MVTIVFYVGPKIIRSDCTNTFNRVYRPMNIDGIVQSTYYDMENHSIGTIYILSKGRKQYLAVNMDSIGLYHFVEPKDSIIKPPGSLTFRVIRNRNDIVIMDTTFELLCRYKYISRWNNLW